LLLPSKLFRELLLCGHHVVGVEGSSQIFTLITII
jgi:hypothetical protein